MTSEGVTIVIPQTDIKVFVSAEQIKWMDIRDYWFGFNGRNRKHDLAIKLAYRCKHPDAQWLYKEEAEESLALFLKASVSGYHIDMELLNEAASKGNIYAKILVATFFSNEDNLPFLKECLLLGEREVFRYFAKMYVYGRYGNSTVGYQFYYCAAQLGCVTSMLIFADSLDLFDPQKWYWYGMAAKITNNYTRDFAKVIMNFREHANHLDAVFMIGRMLKPEYFEKTYIWVEIAEEAIYFYKKQCVRARRAVDAWSLVALRIGNHIINKDMRKKIAEMIWNTRNEIEYF
ncbi:MAG: hypothetical protein K2Q45_00500 [Nitrosomonas sp.]|nr:hypothetical protein [Nitrosomonas sp.]